MLLLVASALVAMVAKRWVTPQPSPTNVYDDDDDEEEESLPL